MKGLTTIYSRGRSNEKEDMQGILDIFNKKDKESGNAEKVEKVELKNSDSLSFLRDDKIEKIFENPYWNLNEDGKEISPLKFSNGKTQEDIVREIAHAIKEGNKVILLHGVCGSGKSAIALNLARSLGKTSIVVPVKALQKQYEDDYTFKKYLVNKSGKKMKIAIMTGRENHDSIIMPGVSCADPSLPENIKITEKNYHKLIEYYEQNPFMQVKQRPDWKQIRRLSIAPSNPYWSPILPADLEIKHLSDARKKTYVGCDGKKYIFYHRKQGCSYYDQYLAYTEADVLIFNAAKYKSELSIGRKPETEIDVIDEADEFLDSLYQQEKINLSRFHSALKQIPTNSDRGEDGKMKILDLIELEEKNKRVLGVNEEEIFPIATTKLKTIFQILNENTDLQSEILLDEMNYSYGVLEAAVEFKDTISEVYCTFSKDEEKNILVNLVSTNLSGKFGEILRKSKALVLMSGTLHSDSILKNIFGIDKVKKIEAETLNLGSIEIIRTGKEMDCKMANFTSKKHSREEYLEALSLCLNKSKLPTLIHVNAYRDLPNEQEKMQFHLSNLISSEQLITIQNNDKTGMEVSLFKSGLKDTLFSTKCARGVDFPGKICNSILFTKYPNPNVGDIFWKIINQNHPQFYWEFYRDKAWREFLQRIFRAVRSRDDHVYILSPDLRVIDAVRQLQQKYIKN